MISVFDHAWASGLFSDPEMRDLWSAETQLSQMIAFEAAYSRALGQAGVVGLEAAEAAAGAIEAITLSPTELAAGMAQDGVPVPALVRHLRKLAGSSAVHEGLTSQDVIDSVLAQTIGASLDLLDRRIQKLIHRIEQLDDRFGTAPLTGRTRMQSATEIAVGDRLRSWGNPLSVHRVRLTELRPRVVRLQFGGASGDRAGLGSSAQTVADSLADSLGLARQECSWHANRDGIAEFAGLLSLITGSLGKIGQDICLMAQQGIDEIALKGGGASSSMPHKSNPVAAEILVTLARFNASQLAAMHHALVHEQERSGSAWTLEWMVLPQMVLTCGTALVKSEALLGDVVRLGRD